MSHFTCLMPSLAVKSFVFDCPSSSTAIGGDTLKITANRYTLEDSAENMEGVTLLFTHCIGSHKEQWEPTISRLFQQQKHKCPAHRIREVWSFDWQSHGDAAVLNREAIRLRSEDCISVYEWASAIMIAAFLRSPYMKDHKVVGLGHSAGAAAVLISTKEFAINDSPYVCVVLIEPTMASRELFYSRYEEHKAAVEFAVNTTSARRDTWNSKDDAFAYFMKRVPWKNWDPRVVRLLVEHGLQATAVGGVVQLKCDKRQEALSYGDTEPHFEGANLISRMCHSLPIHLVFGARDDPVFVLKPDFIKHFLCDTSQGRFVASIRRVKHAGHMVVQEQPDRLADSICGILDGIPTYQLIRSRL